MIHKWRVLTMCLSFVVLLGTHPILAQQSGQLPLAEAGQYQTSVQTRVLTDNARAGAQLSISIWYPAARTTNTTDKPVSGPAMLRESSPLKPNPTLKGHNIANLDAGVLINVTEVQGRWSHITLDDGSSGWVLSDNVMVRPAKPDLSGTPYPLIIYSHGLGGSRWDDPSVFANLASYGFVLASINHTCDSQPTCLIDRPLDILFVLDQLAGISKGDLAGMIAKDNAGVVGVSYGGYTALATTGARIDPNYFLNWYAHRTTHNDASIDVIDSYGQWHIADQWNKIADYANKISPIQAGDLWPATTDPRIRAVMPIIPAGTNVFGEKGIGAATIPTLVMAATDDEIVPYNREIVPMFNHLGSKDRYLISMIGYSHRLFLSQNWEGYYKQFTTAFFGYYLQGKQEDADYLTSTYVGNFSDLAWGIYQPTGTATP